MTSTSWLIREGINGALVVFDVALILFIANRIYVEVQGPGGYRAARSRLGIQAAIAIGIHLVGLTIFRAWSAVLFWEQRHGVDMLGVEDKFPIALIGAAIALIGIACCIRVFSPPGWGHWGWIISAVMAALFVAVELSL